MTDRQLQSPSTSRMNSGVRIGARIFLLVILLFVFGLFRLVLPERPSDYTGLRALSDSFFALGLLAIILLLSGVIGLKIIRWLGLIPSSFLETIVFVVPIGLGVTAYGILALGVLGLLQAQYFILWFIVLFFWSYQEWWELVSSGKDKLRRAFCTFKLIHLGKKLLLLSFLLIFTLTLFQALTPPWDYDGLMYHLQGPRIFLNAGKILPLPDTWGANGPFTIEMLYMFGLRFGSDTFAKLLHMSYAVLLVLATFTFGRRFLGRAGGWIAAAILVAIPIFPLWASWAYADMAWALYEFLSIYALIVWIMTLRREWLVLSGLAMGLALGSKYLALGSAAMLGLVVIWTTRKQGWKLICQNAAIFGGVALLVGSPWYLKNWLWTGNPVYPLYFGGLAWPAERVRLLMSYLNSFGTGHRISDYLLLPWNIYVQNQRFATLGSTIELPGFLFVLLIFYPFMHHKKAINILAIIVLMRFAVWAVGSHQIRFLLPVFPGLSLLTASVLLGLDDTSLRERGGRILRAVLIGSFVVITLFFSVYIFLRVMPSGVIVGNESKLDFLNRTKANISAISYIQKQLAPEDRVLFMWDGEGYYCDERCIPDAEQGRWTVLAMIAAYDTPTISTKLHEAGITHLLYSKGSLDFVLQHDPSGENHKAALFFGQQYRERCTDLIYSDNASSLYKINCK
jgi:4-amino-4-deoxy-L-arabinose transferase-like glycosyltransferase